MLKKLSINLLTRANTSTVSPLLVVVTSVLNLLKPFERLGKEVVLVDIVDTVLNGYYDRDFTQMMAKNLEDHNIRLALGQTVKAIEGDGKVERLITDKETLMWIWLSLQLVSVQTQPLLMEKLNYSVTVPSL